MIRLTALLALTILAGCAVSPEQFEQMNPAMARAYGVNVPDGAVQTGKVIEHYPGFFWDVEEGCLGEPSKWGVVHGCAKAHGIDPPTWPSPTGEYDIHYADRCVGLHEYAKAVFETKQTTHAFKMRRMLGDKLAACPNPKYEPTEPEA